MKELTKEELQNRLYKLEQDEIQRKENKSKNENYQKFLNRSEDWVIGKAHCDIGLQKDSYGWDKLTYSLGRAISINGNAGSSYNPEAAITSATNTYFHNVWTHKQRDQFQKALNKVAVKEINKIMGNLHSIFEILGLQSTSYYLEKLYPKDKIELIKKAIWEETVKLLDRYSDKEFRNFIKENTQRWYSSDGTSSDEINLSHSKSIFKKYITEHRPKLLKLIE